MRREDAAMMQNVEKKIPIVIGVSGHRRLRPQDLPALRAAVRERLVSVQAQNPHSPLVMLCSLAEGADLLCADAGEELGIPLIAALPLPREEYEKDFSPEGKRRLDHHCTRADQIFVPSRSEALPPEASSRNDAYRQTGIYVSAHCHVLLALGRQARQIRLRHSPLEKGMATHSSILAWRIPWTEEPGGLRVHRIAKSWTRLKQFSTHSWFTLLYSRN